MPLHYSQGKLAPLAWYVASGGLRAAGIGIFGSPQHPAAPSFHRHQVFSPFAKTSKSLMTTIGIAYHYGPRHPRYPQHVPHPLLPDALRAQLPMLHAQRNSIEPMLYARYHVPDEPWQFFVAEGEPAGADYLFFGLLMASEEESDWNSVEELPLSQLITVPGVRLDDEFMPATFPDAVPYPYVD